VNTEQGSYVVWRTIKEHHREYCRSAETSYPKLYCKALSRTTDLHVFGQLGDHDNNRNIEADLLTQWLKRQGTSDILINKVLRQLD
jgi:hypothetical protein